MYSQKCDAQLPESNFKTRFRANKKRTSTIS
ncbi:DUF6783 domain-containing protein [uncultured Robinsoniella sp.]